MSDEYENKSGYQAQSSETITGTGSGVSPDMDYVRPAENPEQDLYHAHSFIEKVGILPGCKSYRSTIFFNSSLYRCCRFNFIMVDEIATRFSWFSRFYNC